MPDTQQILNTPSRDALRRSAKNLQKLQLKGCQREEMCTHNTDVGLIDESMTVEHDQCQSKQAKDVFRKEWNSKRVKVQKI